MLKAELHTHTSDDPVDTIPHTAFQLIDRASALGYQVLAITLHDKQFEICQAADYARDRGVVLISGIERTISGKHVLLLNFPKSVEHVESFEDLRALKARTGGLVIAPHPFFPTSACLGDALDRHADLFDAVEVNAFYTAALDFNRRAVEWAEAHKKPLVGNGDVHRLVQLGTTFSRIDARPDAGSIVAAIRAGRVEVEREPITLARACSVFASMAAADTWSRVAQLTGYRRPRRDRIQTASHPHTSPIAAPPTTSNG